MQSSIEHRASSIQTETPLYLAGVAGISDELAELLDVADELELIVPRATQRRAGREIRAACARVRQAKAARDRRPLDALV